MSVAEKRIKKAYRTARAAQLIAEELSMDAADIVRLLPLDDRDREYALEVLRQANLRHARETVQCASVL